MSPAGFVQALFEGRALVSVEFFTKRQRRKISKGVPLLFHQQFDGRLGGDDHQLTGVFFRLANGLRRSRVSRSSLTLRGILLA